VEIQARFTVLMIVDNSVLRSWTEGLSLLHFRSLLGGNESNVCRWFCSKSLWY